MNDNDLILLNVIMWIVISVLLLVIIWILPTITFYEDGSFTGCMPWLLCGN